MRCSVGAALGAVAIAAPAVAASPADREPSPEPEVTVETASASAPAPEAGAASAPSVGPPTLAEVPPPEPGRRTGPALHTAIGAALDNGALAFSLGGRYALSESWLLGVDAEYNPWFSIEATRFAAGAFNGYATAIYRYVATERLAIRVTAHAGVSVLLFDLVGAPAGSVGPFLGGSLLGISYEVDDQVYLVLDPAQVVLPVPQVEGAPFSYHQYRFSLGVQLGG